MAVKKRLTLMDHHRKKKDDRFKKIAAKIRQVNDITEGEISIGDSIGDSIGIPIQRPIDSPIHSPNTIPNGSSNGSSNGSPITLTIKEAALFICLKHLNGAITTLNNIAKETQISEHTLKSCLQRLRKKNMIEYYGRQNLGGRIGFKAKALDRVVELVGSQKELERMLVNLNYNEMCVGSHLIDHLMKPPMNHLILNKEEEDIYILLLSTEKIELIYPTLYSTGFEQKHLKEIIESWKFQKLDTHEVPDSLERAEWAVKHNDKIKDPLNYIYSSLMKGPFAKPAGFVSRAECEAQERIGEAKRIQALNEEAETLEFENWWRGLTEDERNEIDRTVKIKSVSKDGRVIRGHRLNYFRSHTVGARA